MDVWLPINPPICGDCGRAALFETASDDWRKESEVVCPFCGAKGHAPRAIRMAPTPSPEERPS